MYKPFECFKVPGVWKTVQDFMKLLGKPHLKEPISRN